MTIRNLVLSLAALAVGVMLSLASASAGTYEDNVFRKGEPRYGSPINTYEDRNVRRRGVAPPPRLLIVPRGQIFVPIATCARNRRTGRTICW